MAQDKMSTTGNKDAHSPNNTVSSLSKLLGNRVALVDDKVLVKDLKDLPSLKVAHGVLCGVCAGQIEASNATTFAEEQATVTLCRLGGESL
jgi:hypothetical protein